MTTRDVVVLMPEFVARPGLGPEFRERLELLARLSREEAGCLEYTLLEDPTDPCRLRLYERWADAEALAGHDATSYVREFVASFDHFLAEPLRVRRLRQADGRGAAPSTGVF